MSLKWSDLRLPDEIPEARILRALDDIGLLARMASDAIKMDSSFGYIADRMTELAINVGIVKSGMSVMFLKRIVDAAAAAKDDGK